MQKRETSVYVLCLRSILYQLKTTGSSTSHLTLILVTRPTVVLRYRLLTPLISLQWCLLRLKTRLPKSSTKGTVTFKR